MKNNSDHGNGDWFRDEALLIDRLRESDAAGDFSGPASETDFTAHAPRLDTIGRFRTRRVIAAGGMGTVYEAVQDHPRRAVAIKVMRRGIASRSAIRRFQYESQLLARLSHPGIAQIYEAGTHDDGTGAVPWFAMEFIPAARPIIEYAREKDLALRRRLELFIEVCAAVHHGHQKGIIHRDLKPSNILIDAEGRVKIIDFGVARGTDSDMALTTLQTSFGQLIGTLQYMSPEQCGGDPHELDLRTDVYSLGVVLYELLADALPYDVSEKTVLQSTRIIREQAPARLSAIKPVLRGDLETIVLKALEKDRDRRYQSASELGQELRRYLNGEAIIARPPSFAYQLRVFARRNKAVVVALCAVLVILAGASVLSTSMYLQAEGARADAVVAQNAEQAQREIAETREQEARQREAEAVAARQAEERQRQAAEDSFRLAREAVDQMLVQVADRLPQLPGLQEQEDSPELAEMRRALLEQALAFYLDFLRDRSDDPEVQFEAGHAYFRIGQITEQLRQYDRSEETYREAIRLLELTAGEYDDNPEHGGLLAGACDGLGRVMMNTSRPGEAEPLFSRAIQVRAPFVEGDAGNPNPRNALSWNWDQLGWALSELGRWEEAEQAYQRAIEVSERLVADEPGNAEFRESLGLKYINMGGLLSGLTRHEEALVFHKRAVELFDALREEESEAWRHVDWARSMQRMANAMLDGGLVHEASNTFQTAIDDLEGLVSAFPTNMGYQNTLADLLRNYAAFIRMNIRDPAGARSAIERSIELRKIVAAANPTPDNLLALASAYNEAAYNVDFLSERLPFTRESVAIYERLVAEAPDSAEYRQGLAGAHHWLGDALWSNHQVAEAEAEFRRSLASKKDLLDEVPNSRERRQTVPHVQYYLADLLMHTGRLEEAEALMYDAIDRVEGLVADLPDDGFLRRQMANCYEVLGEILWITGRSDEAKRAFRRDFALKEGNVADFPDNMWYELHLLRGLANSPDETIRDPERAIEVALDFHARAPENSDVWLYQGIAHFRLGQWQPAIEALNRSMELVPEDIEFHSAWHYSFQLFHLAIAHWRLGEEAQARALYEQAEATMLEEMTGLGPDGMPRLKIQRIRAEARAIFEGAPEVIAPADRSLR